MFFILRESSVRSVLSIGGHLLSLYYAEKSLVAVFVAVVIVVVDQLAYIYV